MVLFFLVLKLDILEKSLVSDNRNKTLIVSYARHVIRVVPQCYQLLEILDNILTYMILVLQRVLFFVWKRNLLLKLLFI